MHSVVKLMWFREHIDEGKSFYSHDEMLELIERYVSVRVLPNITCWSVVHSQYVDLVLMLDYGARKLSVYMCWCVPTSLGIP